MTTYSKCSKCKKDAVGVATSTINEFYIDIDEKYYGREIIADEEICVSVHICFECGYLVDIDITHPLDRIHSIIR